MTIHDFPHTKTPPSSLAERNLPIGDHSAEPVVGATLDGTVCSWNRGAQRLFGYEASEAIGRPLALILPAHLSDEDARGLERVRSGERPAPYHTIRRTKDGREIAVAVTLAPIEDADGNVVGVSEMFRDVSGAGRDPDGASGPGLRAVIDAVPAAIFFTDDADARHIQANRVGHELLQALRAEAGASAPAPEAPEELRHLLRAACANETPSWEMRVVMRDGRTHHFLGNAVQLHDARGKPAGAVALLSDVTERVHAESSLKDADRRKDEFLAMLAHELRNPLTPIKTSLEIIHKGLADERRRNWALEVIDRQLVQLTRIIDDLLELGRIASGSIALKREATSLRAIVSQALEVSRPTISASRHALQVSLPVQEIRLHADRARLAQALSNLLANSAKFTAPGGTIAILGERRGDTVEIRVKDSGRGMDPEALPHVFDMFMQSAGDLTGGPGGLGVGLSVVRRIVELHGGAINVYSEGRDKGSEFVLIFPLGNDAVPADEPRPAARPRRVLVVDDNRDITDSIAELLQLNGHEVARHYDGNGVLEKVLSFHPEVLIIDLGLPGKSGYEVAALLRSHPDFRDLPLIALSGYGQPANVERSRASGFDFHLLKPADPKLLLQLVDTMIARQSVKP